MIRLFALISASLALCAAIARANGLDPALQEARLEQMGRDREGAARMYAVWLDANPGSAQAPAVFDRYFTTEQDLSSLLDTGEKFLMAADKGALLGESMERIARLFEIAGKTEEARDAFLSSFAHGGSFSSLESAFLLSLQMNDADALQSTRSAAKGAENEIMDFFAACAALQKGEYGPASASLSRIADTAADQSIALKALWLGYRMAARSGDPAARQVALRRLQARFPRSPEYALAVADDSTAGSRASSSVSVMPLPDRFFSEASDSSKTISGPSVPAPQGTASQGTAPQGQASRDNQAPPDKASPDQAPTAAAGSALSVQAGSFQMKENADDLIAELTRKGFSPTLRIDAQQGKPLYRVFAGSGLSVDEARALLDRLHGAGFSGFLLKDQ